MSTGKLISELFSSGAIRKSEDEGIDIGNGKKKVGDSIVVKSRWDQKKPQEKPKPKQQSTQQKDSWVPPPAAMWETLEFKTPVGNLQGQYWPVINTGCYLVLGLAPNTFVPLSYKESPDLVLETKVNNKELKVIYTGCRFKDPDINREYIIMMELT